MRRRWEAPMAKPGRVVFFLVLASAAFSVLILSRWIEVAVQ
jgi:hypothetical protein